MPLPISLPYTFANATTAIPLANLDSDLVTLRDGINGIGNGTNALSNVVITGGTIDGTSIGATTSSTGRFSTVTATTGNITTINATNVTATGNVSVGANITFTGTGNRITGDFSNATIANRVLLQSTTSNANSFLGVVPNGTGNFSGFNAFNTADPTNSTQALFGATSVDVRLVSTITGTGTYLPMTFYTGGSERMRVDTSGNVGIGTSSPSSFANYTTLTINGTDSDIDLMRGGVRQLAIYTTSTLSAINNVANLPLLFYTNSTERARITAAGEVYIAGTTDQGAYNLQCNGTGVWGAGAYVNGSDARLKEEIKDLPPATEIVASLRPVTFRYKSDYSRDTNVQPGFIAQELQQALSGTEYVDGVVQAGPEHLNVAYQALIPVLTKALQEAMAEITSLKARVAALENA